MQATNKNIAIYAVLILIILGSSTYVWWRARVQPDQVLARIETKLTNFEKEISDCKKQTEIKELEKCSDRMEEIADELDNMQADLIGIRSAESEVATSTVK